MPPQQCHRLLDIVDDLLDFRTHGSPFSIMRGFNRCAFSTQWVEVLLPTESGSSDYIGAGRAEPPAEIDPVFSRCRQASIKAAGSGAHCAVGLGRNPERPTVSIGHPDDGIIVGGCGARLEGLKD